ncbi:uncharacterized protein NDAI_0C04910 [Naumovozyma dairenensis CBS 421]|uniref:Svf1-like C-terminal domain-containing protein n=1 Tax=Naumovozyma dairenensis (strain ATCC 10597 / BCRC 20456 / CBS 421 / NBRC 0211 / NRRL Y-12639) TaxID=1071378 RepID=G0W8N9_NAUDC|nr:hypothetical protein NDAI_0C04910 [Naumovozyma dairenensis CBS 421]CCD24150.1 hypothetical protein NDAI_0C04910 [Naumovozyma dairenensis CBS 421]
MSGSKTDKTKFLPVRTVNPNDPVVNNEDSNNNNNNNNNNNRSYTLINDYSALEIFCASKRSHSSGKNKTTSLLKSLKPPSIDTRVETETLYFTDLNNNVCGFVQILYSNVMGGIYKGFQMNFKMFETNESQVKFSIWESIKIPNVVTFDKFSIVSDIITFQIIPNGPRSEKNNNKNKGCSLGKLLIIVNLPHGENTSDLQINLKVDLYQGFKMNPDGTSYFLDKSIHRNDQSRENVKSSRYLRHVFVPRGICEGTISYKDKATNKSFDFDFEKVPVCYLDAVQGMVPNKAASKWNFMTFQSLTYSILLLEYTTTRDFKYGTVTTWAISRDEEIISIGSQVNNTNIVKFKSTILDKETGWEYPSAIKFNLFLHDDADANDKFEEDNLNLVNRYDIFHELPSIVKNIASEFVHINPYLYQYCQRSKFRNEEGISIVESTFISR